MNILRWIGVIPGSLIAFLTADVIWRIINSFTTIRYFDSDSWIYLIFVEIMSSAVAGASFIYAGTYIAPNFKKETALILTIIFSMLSGALLFITNFMTGENFPNIAIIAGVIGAIACYFEILNSENKKEDISKEYWLD